MTAIGIIGSGRIGSTVAKLAVGTGHHVVLSNSRGRETLEELVTELGPQARAATRDEAAAAGELVVVSIPIKAYPTLSGLPLGGRIVMDTGNYYPDRDGDIPELAAKTLTDSEYLVRYLPDAEVVKVFNNIFYKHLLNLTRPAGASDRSALPIAGDSPSAKAAVSQFLGSIGYEVVDTGALSDGWRQQSGTPVYGTPYGLFDNEHGTPADAGAIREGLAAASR
jgi:8-hydroxy-5-deazaflavin:NADPH oxidoreductase